VELANSATVDGTARFQTTLWSVIIAAAQNETRAGETALPARLRNIREPFARLFWQMRKSLGSFSVSTFRSTQLKIRLCPIRPVRRTREKAPHTIWSTTMSIMKILNSVEQEQFESPPVFNSVQRKQHFDFSLWSEPLALSRISNTAVPWTSRRVFLSTRMNTRLRCKVKGRAGEISNAPACVDG
jgi:hypothetical protein